MGDDTGGHVRVANINRGYMLYCLHCGAYYTPSLPVAMDMFLAMTESFGKSHADCGAPETPFNEERIQKKYFRSTVL